MTNNFELFKREFVEWEFYFIQLIKRKKDNPDEVWINWNNSARCIKTYTIRTKEELEKRKQEMIDIATVTNSRIYIRPSRRKDEDIKNLMSLLIWEHLYYWRHRLSWLYNHACWLDKWIEKLWVIDIDNGSWNHTIAWIKKTILTLRWDARITMQLPTKNWLHLITTPFDMQGFKEIYPHIDVHKNNPTLLYCL